MSNSESVLETKIERIRAMDITIVKQNETYMKVHCSEVYMELDIQDRFSFEIPNAKYDPRVKFGKWDGIKRLYNRKTKKLYIGLLLELLNLCEQKGWSYEIDPELLPSNDQISDEDLSAIINEVIQPHSDGNPIEPYDYQLEAVKYALNMDRSTLLLATAAGKSLVQYLLVRIYQLMNELKHKTIFICVPSISLVEQMYNDFKDYSTFDGSNWHVDKHCQKISSKYTKQINTQIVITTWQSMCKLPHDLIENAGACIVDETHTASASVLTGILESLHSCQFRHGLTGTLNTVESDQLTIQGLLGPAKRIVSAHDLIQQGRASDVHVNMLMLNYSQKDKEQYISQISKAPHKMRYQEEVSYLINHEGRRKFVLDLVHSLDGNTLVLFDRVEEFGKILYEQSKELHDNSFLIVGEIDSQERESIRQSIEQYNDAIIWASSQTMSTGVSIKKLHNLVIISSSKSKIKILQSIGRLMRLHNSKDKANIIDLVDNLTYKDNPNYVLKHAQTRLEYYNQEKFKIKFEEFNIE
jgi:superfamily II DNA or RNA helicase